MSNTQEFDWVCLTVLWCQVLKVWHMSICMYVSIHAYMYVFHTCMFSRCKKSFRSFTQWSPTKAPLWICCRAYSTLWRLPAFCNIQKLNLVSKNGHAWYIYIYIYIFAVLTFLRPFCVYTLWGSNIISIWKPFNDVLYKGKNSFKNTFIL